MKKLYFYLCFLIIFLFFSCDVILNNSDQQLAYISITQKPTKMSYFIGEEFDKTGLCVCAYYLGTNGSSKKDVTNSVSILGFDSTQKNSYLPITVTYTENGITKSTSFDVSINEISLKYPYYDYDRTVKVSFQYYRRESMSETFQKYSYSEDPTDDINGTILFKIDTKKGVSYSFENVISAYKYYPDNKSTSATLYNINENNVKTTKYIGGKNVYEKVTSEGYMPYSFLFTSIAKDIGLSVYGSSSHIGGVNTLLFEDMLIKAIRKTEFTSFKGTKYPIFESDSNYSVTKATLFSQVNDYFVCLITVETTVQDVDIDWPASLWGIDHFE